MNCSLPAQHQTLQTLADSFLLNGTICFFSFVMTSLCFVIILQDRYWGWAGLDLQHGQSCRSLRCCAMLSLGWGGSRCSRAWSSCPEGLSGSQQLQVPLWLAGMGSKLHFCSPLFLCFPFLCLYYSLFNNRWKLAYAYIQTKGLH